MAELLAPAGSLDSVLTAIDAGADAVYLGGKLFNARKFAHNLDDAELVKAVETAHLFGVRIYVTVNILLADAELEAVTAYLQQLDRLKVDGVIVQDLAVAALVRSVAPALPLHGSTQMTVADLHGVRMLEALGFTQVVLSRELSLVEISQICAQAKAKIEVFIHGASCMSYSGQCLMSSFIGGRSGNRGACAQPCRLPYRLVNGDGRSVTDEPAYMLSLKDLNSTALLDKLIDAGVASFKIEGRMKGGGYVRSVVQAYRGMLDAHHRSGKERLQAREEADILLADSFNRAYQSDFLLHTVGRCTVTEKTSGNQGKRIGTVLRFQKNEALVLAQEPLKIGDTIKIVGRDGREYIDEVQFVLDGAVVKGKTRYTITLRRTDLCTGDIYRLAHQADCRHGAAVLQRRLPVYFHADVTGEGQLRLTAWDENGHAVARTADYVPPRASKHPATAQWLRTQVDRLGDTSFSTAEVTIWDESYMIPSSVLNGLRREVVRALEEACLADYVRPAAGVEEASVWKTTAVADIPPSGMELAVRCDSLPAVEAAVEAGADRIIYGGESYQHQRFVREDWSQAVAAAHAGGASLWAASPRILRQEQVQEVQFELLAAAAAGVDGFYAGALGIFSMLRRVQGTFPIEADWSLNIFNTAAANVYARLGCSGLTVSPELMLRQIRALTKGCCLPTEVLVQGRLEMMVTEYCVVTAFAGKGCKAGCSGACRGRQHFLQDRRDEKFPVVTDQYCRNHILNSRDLDLAPYYDDLVRAGIRRLRIEGRGRELSWIGKETARYRRLCDGTETLLLGKEDQTVTRGHYFHGIL